MASITWKSGISGLFSTAADWNGGIVPGSGDDAILGAFGTTAYTVTAVGQVVNDLQTSSHATLAVAAGQTFQMINGTGSGVNAGTIQVGDNATLYLGGTVDNTNASAAGGIQLNATGNSTEIRLTGTSTNFTGGGTVVMGGGSTNYIFGNNGAGNTLNNVNNTFSGVGQLGNGSLTMVNQAAGVVDANQTGALTLNCNGGVTNGGLLEATNTGGLFILNTTVDNTANTNGGKVQANGAGARVDLQNSYFVGGTFSTTGTGAMIDVVSGQAAYLDGSEPGYAVNIASASSILVNNNSTLYLYGTINNAGTITLGGSSNTTEIRVTTPVVSLAGGGSIVMSTGGTNYIFGNGGALNELDNVNNTISGVGQLGNGDMTLLNETAGVVNANQTGALTLNCNGGVTNDGLLEATNTGGLFILNTGVDNTQSSNAGKITANGAGARVDLQNSTISGGTLTTIGTGAVIDVVSGQSATFDGTTSGAPVNIAAGSTIMVNNNATLYLRGIINNTGTIDLGVNAEPNGTAIRINSALVTLEGGGTVQLSNSGNNYIFANNGAQQTLDNVDNKIQGSGNLGNGDMTLVNGKLGVIDANQAYSPGSTVPGQLVLNVNGNVTNSGLIEATLGTGNPTGGDLFIVNTFVDDSSGGTIQASGKGSLVDLQNSTIYGGTVSALTGGIVDVVSGQIAALDGLNSTGVTLTGTFTINNNATLYLQGLINNKATINLNAGVNSTIIRINSPTVTLSGAGMIILSPSANNLILSNSGDDSLVNVNNTISGAGNIGDGSYLVLVNQTAGVINGNQVTALIIDANSTVENTGLIESATSVGSAGGLFILNSNIDNTGNSNAGKITASGTTGHVDLQNSTIYGGTLITAGSGVIDVVSGQAAGLDGNVSGHAVNISAGSNFLLNNNAVLYLYGTIANAGTITLGSTGNITDVRLNSSVVTLTGGGNVVMTDNTNNRIFQNQGSAELDNVNNTISGAGQLGAGGMVLVNGGTINANQSIAIVINTGAAGTNTNTASGILEGSGAGGLILQNGTYTNLGLIEALDGSFVTYQSTAGNTNNSGGTLTGGTWEASANGHGATLSITGGAVVTDAATIILSGTGSVFQAGDGTTFTAIEQSLTTIAAAGALNVLGARGYTTSNILTVNGVLDLAGGVFTEGGLTNLSGTTLTGGTYIVSAGGTLQLPNNVSIVTLNATVDLNGAKSNIQSLNTTTSHQVTIDSTLTTIGASGKLEILGHRNYATGKALSNAGLVQLGGGTLTAASLTDAAGSTLSGFGTVAALFSDAGTVTATGGTLSFTHTGDSFAGAINGSGTVAFAGGTDAINSGTTITTTALSITGGASVTLNENLTYAGTLTEATGTTLGITSGDTLTLTGTSTLSGTVSGAGALTFGGGSSTLSSGLSLTVAKVAITGAATTVTLGASLAYGGAFSQATGTTVVLGSNTLSLSGTSTLAGTVSGPGTLAFTGGTATLNTGFSINSTTWSIASGVTVAEKANVTFAGSLTDASSSLTLGGMALTLTGAASFTGSKIDGTGSLTTKGATTVAGLTLGGAASWLNFGTATESAAVTIGDASGNTATITNETGATYDITGNVGIVPISGGSGSFANLGLLEKTAGTGSSTIGLAVNNGGTITVASGALDLSGSVAGTGALDINGATLKLDGTVAATQTVNFSGSGSDLVLTNTAGFAAGIAGFAAGNTLDLTAFAFSGSPTVGFTENAGNTQGTLTVTDGALHASFTLFGQYVAAGFHTAKDSGTGTAITYVPPPTSPLGLAAAHH